MILSDMIIRILTTALALVVLVPVCLLLAWVQMHYDDGLDVRPRAPEQNTWPESEIES
jgi:hypothetical protein